MNRLAVLGRNFTNLARHRPDLALALIPPIGFLPFVRRWVSEQLDLETAELRLRAITPPDELEAVAAEVDATHQRNVEWAKARGFTPPTRAETINTYIRVVTWGQP